MDKTYQDALAYYGIDSAHPGGLALTKEILQNEKFSRYTKILDAGCGTGKTAIYLAKTFSCPVYGIDIHPEMIKIAARRTEGEKLPVTFMEASIENLPFPNNTFDYIIAESATAFSKISKTLKEYCRVLKPAGILLNMDMAAEQRLSGDEKDEITSFYKMSNVLTEKEWIRAIKMAGFKKVEVLKSNTVIQALEEYAFEEEAGEFDPEKSDEKMNEILQMHYDLTFSYGEKLGFRVFKAAKLDYLAIN